LSEKELVYMRSGYTPNYHPRVRDSSPMLHTMVLNFSEETHNNNL
jgi:hypothetical protein